jgi:hypothetical protein
MSSRPYGVRPRSFTGGGGEPCDTDLEDLDFRARTSRLAHSAKATTRGHFPRRVPRRLAHSPASGRGILGCRCAGFVRAWLRHHHRDPRRLPRHADGGVLAHAAVIAGPPIGVGGAWTREGDWWFGASTGPAVLAGVLVGEPIYALSTIASTTPPPYWLVELAVGVVIVVLAGGVRIVSRDVRPRLAIPVCVVTTGLAAAVVAATARLA